jgi:DNA polymerase-3 subunit gamma/tau
MYQVIARKYRPAQFSELISQEHVRTTLENAIRQQRIAHGYILSGQRGTGKTTVARIIARCLNCIAGPTAQPCGECASCREIAGGSSVDVIEIDAASNRGINEMRELRENVRYRPARDRYKVFIIDEAHQITTEAFNALLKTLEEPPEWVVFILCTTEVHKIPVTIASRCQQFSFRSVDFKELITRMRWICEQEGIQAGDEVLGILAQAGEGSVRDSLSALDQAIACCGNELNAENVRALLGMFSLDALKEISAALETSDANGMLEVVDELERNGRSLHHFCRELARYFRNLLVAKIAGKETRLIGASAPEQGRLIEIASKFSQEDLSRYLQLTLDIYKELQFSLQPRLHLEIGLLRLVHAGRLASIEELLSTIRGGGSLQTTAPKPVAAPPPPPVRTGPSPFSMDTLRKAPPAPAPVQAPPPPASGDLRDRFIHALHDMKREMAIDNLEQSAMADSGGEIVITAAAGTVQALQFLQPDLDAAAKAVLGRPARFRFVTGEVAAAPAAASAPKRTPNEDEVLERALSDPAVKIFRDTFEGAEVRQVRNLKDQ